MTKREVIEILKDIRNLRENKDIPFELIEKYIMMIGEKDISGTITSSSKDWGTIRVSPAKHGYEVSTVELSDKDRSANKRNSEGDPYPF